MLGAEIPDLATSPCPACGELIDPSAVVWDAWHQADLRQAAAPFHPACADFLPPSEASTEQGRCGICEEAFEPAAGAAAFQDLHNRFKAATAELSAAHIVWRLAARDPRRYVPEHFECVLNKATRKKR